MEKKINYQKTLQNTIKNLKISKNKPKLLLHVCCGPCSTIPLKQLINYFDITLFFNNSNIYPKEEYDRRLDELKRFISSNDYKNLSLIVTPYEGDNFLSVIEPYKDLKEGYERCRVCFRKRLEEAFVYGVNNGFEYIGTVMTISRYKNAQDINKIGLELEKKYPTVKWLCADFKKNNGYEDSLIICKENNLYFQEYCGCKFSYLAYKNKREL